MAAQGRAGVVAYLEVLTNLRFRDNPARPVELEHTNLYELIELLGWYEREKLIPVIGSQPAGVVSHKPDGRLPLTFARPAVTPTTLKRAATSLLLGE